MRLSLFLLLGLLTCTRASAQSFSGGFRAGLNFITLSGPLEKSEDGQTTYERLNRTTGFHVGATFAYQFTDLVGVKADLMYSQKGGEFLYNDGPSYFFLYAGTEDLVGEYLTGTRNSQLDVVNSYIDVPLTAHYRLGKFEIEGGVSAGFLILSRVSGGITYTDVPGFPGEEFAFSVNGNYFRDDAGGAGVLTLSDTPLGNGLLPPDAISVYYNSNSNEKLFRRISFGLIAGVSYYLNNGLYIGARYQYGLTDITNDANDLRITADPDVRDRVFNTGDKDYSRSIQASVGFRF